MKYKTFEQLQKENMKLKVAFVVSIIVFSIISVFFMIVNADLVNQSNYYQVEYKKQKAKADVLKDELDDIKMSGTCLMRIPEFEDKKDV